MASPPSSQKADVRPVSFILEDGANTGTTISMDLYLRPEDLTRNEPSRINTQQTLGGGAWADNFGLGIARINISGHTGWQRDNNGQDGIDRFETLHDDYFAAWHENRRLAVNNGRDPDLVQLTFIDGLDNFSVNVVPMGFVLRRNKARPLLIQYQIDMMAVAPLVKVPPLTPADKTDQGLDSLTASINNIIAFAKSINQWVQANIVGPCRDLMNKVTSIYQQVQSAVSAIESIPASLLSAAQDLTMACVNTFRCLAAVANIPNQVKGELMAIASEFTNVYCLLKNALSQSLIYQDYTPLLGASNCSSTNGGAPLSSYATSNTNPFYDVAPVSPPAVTLTNQAQTSLKTLANMDPVLAPPTQTTLAANITTLAAGLTVAA